MMNKQNGIQYESNYARAAASFLASCAPRQDDPERAAAYDLLTGIYTAISQRPAQCGLRPVPDVWFYPFEQQRDRKKDVKAIRDSIKKIKTLLTELYHLVQCAEVRENCLVLNEACAKPGKLLISTLREAGVPFENGTFTFADGCAQGLRALAEIAPQHAQRITDGQQESKEVLFFSRCVFDADVPWTAMAFDRALGADGQLLWLCEALEKRGYQRIDCKDGNRLSLDYCKQYGKKEKPLKMAWADQFHYGIELSFEDLQLEPYYIWLRMADYKTVLAHCNDFPDAVSDFLLQNTKTCNGCRYCVQTDKTGTRPLAAVSVKGEQKCPFFPAFSLNWRVLTPEMAKNLLAVLDAAYPSAE